MISPDSYLAVDLLKKSINIDYVLQALETRGGLMTRVILR